MLITLIKMGLLMLSYLGYWEFIRVRCSINIYFIPVFTVASQFSVLFIAGILNFLTEAMMAIYIVGLILFLYCFRKEKWRMAAPYIKAGFVFLFLALALVAMAVYGKRFSEIDNFTHWALVVKIMLNTGRFPSFADTAIEYTSYPLGSAALICYFCMLTSGGEHMQMLAQAFILLCTVLPFFAYVKRHVVLCFALIAWMVGFLFHYNIPITELHVDTLLPLAGMAAIAFVNTMCSGTETEEKLSPYYSLPLLFWTMNIKNAGIFYVLLALGLLFLSAKEKGRNRKQIAIMCMILIVGLFVWNHHCSYVYPEANTSRHAMTIAWFGQVIGNKTVSDVWEIVRNFIGYTITRQELRWILMWSFVLTLLAWGITPRLRKAGMRFLLCVIFLHLLYSAGVLGMYIFSLPEAGVLWGIDRYMRSGDIAVYYVIVIFTVSVLSEIDSLRSGLAVSAGLMVLCIMGWRMQTGEDSGVALAACTMEWRDRIEMPISEYGIEKKRSYLLCIDEEDNLFSTSFPAYIWRYNMETSAVEQIVVTKAEQLDIEKEYDYLIIFDEDNPVIQKWLQENYPNQAGRMVIQHFT